MRPLCHMSNRLFSRAFIKKLNLKEFSLTKLIIAVYLRRSSEKMLKDFRYRYERAGGGLAHRQHFKS